MLKSVFISLNKLILFIGLSALSVGCYSQAYNFQQLSIQQGLPQSQAYTVLFDSSQFAWIGTQGGGLCKYDGREFEYFTKNDSLISNRIYSLQQVGNELWIGQKGGVTVFNMRGDFLRNYRLENRSTLVQDILEFNETILIATDKGMKELMNDKFVENSDNVSLQEVNVHSFFMANKELWLCTTAGLLNYKEPLTKINKTRGLSIDDVICAAVYDNYWIIGTYGGGINIYNRSEGILKSNPFRELNDMIILTLFEASNGEFWIGTLNNGVYVYSKKDETLNNYQTSNGLSNNHVRTIVGDYWENIWIGTSGGGVSIFQNSPFVEYNMSAGLNGNYVYTVMNSRKNDIWLGTEGTGVVRINDTSAVIFDEEFGFYSEKVKTIFEDNNGDIWIGSEGKGLGIFSQYDGKDTIYSYSGIKQMSSDWIRCFSQDKKRTIYIGTGGGGVMSVEKNWEFPLNIQFKKVNPSNGEFPARINSLDYIENQLWFTASDNHYGYYKNGKIVKLISNEASFRNCVGSGEFRWLGSTDNGILQLRVENDSIIENSWITTGQGLSSNNIYQLIQIDNSLWVGTEKGLDQVIFDSLNIIISVEHFGYEEGFEGVETNINASYKNDDGKLWFGTVDGLYLYQGGEVNYKQRKPPVLMLTDISIFYESIEKTEFADFFEGGKMIKELTLPYNMNHVGFSFKAIHYTYSRNIRYRWKLSGADPDWTPPTKITTATYSNLAPGNYSFELKASIDDNWDVTPIKIEFKIDEPYWEKFWFKASYYCVTGLMVAIIVLIVVYRTKRKHRIIREKIELEKNLIELEQKALRLQMNPHFIFNVLNSIHNLIILNDPDKARYALSKFSKMMRRVLENSREKFISVDDELETLENYVQLEKLTTNLDVELVVTIDDKLDAAEEILPPLMIQPFVENAIIHGLKEIEHPGIIKVGFNLINEHLLECSVEDNGRGRLLANQMNAQKENYHKSTALQVTQERLANLNTDKSFVPFEIIDITDKNGNAAGTRVIIRILI